MIDIPTSPDDKFVITREALDNFIGWMDDARQTRAILNDLIKELYATSFDRYRATGERQGTNKNLEAMLEPTRKAYEKLKGLQNE